MKILTILIFTVSSFSFIYHSWIKRSPWVALAFNLINISTFLASRNSKYDDATLILQYYLSTFLALSACVNYKINEHSPSFDKVKRWIQIIARKGRLCCRLNRVELETLWIAVTAMRANKPPCDFAKAFSRIKA